MAHKDAQNIYIHFVYDGFDNGSFDKAKWHYRPFFDKSVKLLRRADTETRDIRYSVYFGGVYIMAFLLRGKFAGCAVVDACIFPDSAAIAHDVYNPFAKDIKPQ